MKKRRTIILSSIILIAVVSYVFWHAGSSSHPALVFTKYDNSGTNAHQFAKFELQNTTRSPIWLCFSGEGFPLSPGFLERPAACLPQATNGVETNVYSIRAGSFLMRGEELLPGRTLVMDFPLVSGKAPEQVGLFYYVGNFKDGNDFLSYLCIPLLDNRANLKEKIKFYWDKAKRSSRIPKYHEVWCPTTVSFQTETSYPTNTPLN